MAGVFWDLDYSSTPPQTPPPLRFSSELRHSSVPSSYDSSPLQDGVDWPSLEQVEFTTLNPFRNKDSSEGEWHIVTATHSLLSRGRQGQKEALPDQQKPSYNSLPRAHFLQPNRESSAFSPYSNDFWLNGRDAKNIAESPRSRRELHPLTQPGFYSPKLPRSRHWEAAQSAKKSLKGSASTNNLKDFCALTLPLPFSKTAVLKPSPLCSKPQKVQTSVVEKPPLMRAVLSQASPTSNQHADESFCHIQLRHDHPIKKQNPSLEHSRKPPKNDHLSWSQRQNVFPEDLPTNDHLHINTHVFPEYQSRGNQPAAPHPKLEKTSHEKTDAGIKPSQGDPERSCQLQPDCSPKQRRIQNTQDRESDLEHNQVSQVDVSSRNVFGQPRLRASLRAARSPRPIRKSSVLEELKKLIVMDDTEDSAQADSSSPQQTEAERCRSLHISSSCASLSSPVLTPINLHLQSECRELPEQVESELWDGDQHPDPELMPLPSTACDLDWNSLVQAAQEYETQRMATLLSEMSPVPSRPDTPSHGTYRTHQSSPYCFEDDMDSDVFIDFPDQLSHLEGMLKRLSSDLLKEKRDKVALLAEVLKLRISNQHLREESFCAVAQLHKISNILNTAPGETE